MLAQTFGKPAVSTAQHGARTLWRSFSAGPGKHAAGTNVGRKSLRWDWRLEANLNRKANGLALEDLLWDFTYLCWNLTPDRKAYRPAGQRDSFPAGKPGAGRQEKIRARAKARPLEIKSRIALSGSR